MEKCLCKAHHLKHSGKNLSRTTKAQWKKSLSVKTTWNRMETCLCVMTIWSRTQNSHLKETEKINPYIDHIIVKKKIMVLESGSEFNSRRLEIVLIKLNICIVTTAVFKCRLSIFKSKVKCPHSIIFESRDTHYKECST